VTELIHDLPYFGPVLSIEAEKSYDLEPFLRDAAYSLLGNNPQPYENIHRVKFPEITRIIVRYVNHTCHWDGFDVPNEVLDTILEHWIDAPVEKTPYTWSKTVLGHEFKMRYYSVKKDIHEH
jgi:hypothetical protein